MKKKSKFKIITFILTGAIIVFMLWGALSYIDVLTSNLSDNTTLATWNVFNFLLK